MPQIQEPQEPQFFYRVYDNQSVSKLTEYGFQTPDAAFDPSAPWAKHVVKRHMDWSNRSPSPFISVTDSEEKACEYARQRVELGHTGVLMATINVSELRRANVSFWHMQTLARELHAYVEPRGWNPNEWLCLHYIPNDAVEVVESW
jgi:hypothetical protein